jgi:hypothetical protein
LLAGSLRSVFAGLLSKIRVGVADSASYARKLVSKRVPDNVVVDPVILVSYTVSHTAKLSPANTWDRCFGRLVELA